MKTKYNPNELPPRLAYIREKFFQTKPSISIHKARATTKIMRENPGTPLILVRAQAIYQVCQDLPIYIGDGELIVGHPGGKVRAGIFSPEICWKWVCDELDTVHLRQQDPYHISDKDKKILKEEIFPFWQGKSVEEAVHAEMSSLGILPITYESGIVDCEVKTASGGCDLSPGYANILLKKGFLGIKETAQQKLNNMEMHLPENLAKLHFLKAVCIVCDAIILLAKRYSELASEMALDEKNAKRKKELIKIADVCKNVPANPPRNFHEALQSIWFGQVAFYLEENTSGTSPGRVDQYTWEYFHRDLKAGWLSKEQAQELLLCFLMKFNEIPWPLSKFASYYFAGYIPFLNIVVGGQTRDGKDATNDLSYMILDSIKRLKMYQPSLSARVHNNSSQKLLLAMADLISEGLGFPAIHFDNTTIKMLLSRGVTLENARDYCLMGCVEPYVHGKLFRWSSTVYTNFPIAIEFALTNGIHRKSGKKLGLETGDLSTFDTFYKFEQAVKKQLQFLIKVSATATNVTFLAHKKLLPKIISSSLVEGCVESAKEIMEGGAKYNSGPGIIYVGTADYANSMAVIKKLVYQKKRFSLQELDQALTNNFEGYAKIYYACLDVPKYGNDCDQTDYFATDIIDFVSKEINQMRSPVSNMELGTLSVTTNIPQGEVIGALPSGRKAGRPLADGISPSQGTDILGPTAAIKSVDKINQESTSVGTLFNMKLDPSLLADDRGKENLVALIRAHNQLGGAQIQFNCVPRETLLAAQKNPEEYRSLMVRVSGYSAYFTELCKEVQNDIIDRSVHSRW